MIKATPRSSRRPQCELCLSEADLFCPADSAFLCSHCDADVHRANFLVARHLRSLLCRVCSCPTPRLASGESLRVSRRGVVCGSCSSSSAGPAAAYSSSSTTSSSSLDCLSSCESSSSTVARKGKPLGGPRPGRRVTWGGKISAAKPARAEAEGVFVKWCEGLGLQDGSHRTAVVSCANWALRLCLEHFPVLRPKMRLAAAFWFSVMACGDRSAATWKNLKRFEEVSGVSAGFLRAFASKIARAAKSCRRDLQEGWDES